MFAFFSTLAFFAETGHAAAESGFMRFYNQYLNIPGFEAWKFLNLAIFHYAGVSTPRLPKNCFNAG